MDVFLKEADIKPHLSRYWLNTTESDPLKFEEEVREVCAVYAQAARLAEEGIHTISTDEMTGVQALERIAESKLTIPGKVARLEFEYKRHGTLSLMSNLDVATGEIIAPSIGATRTEADFAWHIAQTVTTDQIGRWIIVCDNLNTHLSASLVELIAQECGTLDDLGEKGESGILKNMATRRAFLTDESHRIRFVYTPKHSSWLNQIEIWFGILMRKLLKRGNFKSVEELKERILAFIDYYNAVMAKPFKWTYKGRPLQA